MIRTNCCTKMQKVYQCTVYRVLRGVRDYFVDSDYIKKIAAKLRG